MFIVFRLLRESVIFAYQSVIVNKLRTGLSLLGITIGIVSIISVFTVIDSLERGIRNSISALGNDVIYIQKWPWAMGGEYPWWKYVNRPVPSIKEFDQLKKKSNTAADMAFMISTERSVKYKNNSSDRAVIVAHSHDLDRIRGFEIEQGRYFSEFESRSGRNIALVGNKIAGELFQNENPIGRSIKIGGAKVKVIGLLKKEGKNELGGGGSFDEVVLIPINYVRNLVNIRRQSLNPLIMVKAKENVAVQEMKDELKGLMRGIRKLRPVEEDDFALNQSSLLSSGIESIFGAIDIAGWLIGGFSILVGGFGIANIMFVSVKERTNMIGIQKALGAKNYFIWVQFMTESVLLSLTGGAIGLLLIYIGSRIASNSTDLNLALTPGNIILGLSISFVIGMISGFAPAYKASKLKPVEAINDLT